MQSEWIWNPSDSVNKIKYSTVEQKEEQNQNKLS